jgi:hypothetical protein
MELGGSECRLGNQELSLFTRRRFPQPVRSFISIRRPWFRQRNFWAKTSVTGASLRGSKSKYCVEICYGKSEPNGKCLVKRELALAEIWLLACQCNAVMGFVRCRK